MSAVRVEPTRARPSRLRRRWLTWSRGMEESDGGTFLVLLLASLVAAAAIAVWPTTLPPSLILVPMTMASVTLGPRQLPWFVVASLAFIALGVPCLLYTSDAADE